jgi:hypothetical protein
MATIPERPTSDQPLPRRAWTPADIAAFRALPHSDTPPTPEEAAQRAPVEAQARLQLEQFQAKLRQALAELAQLPPLLQAVLQRQLQATLRTKHRFNAAIDAEIARLEAQLAVRRRGQRGRKGLAEDPLEPWRPTVETFLQWKSRFPRGTMPQYCDGRNYPSLSTLKRHIRQYRKHANK